MQKYIGITVLIVLIVSCIGALIQVDDDIFTNKYRISHLCSNEQSTYFSINSGESEYIVGINEHLEPFYLYSQKKTKSNEIFQIEDIACDSLGNIYLLTTLTNINNKNARQEMVRLNINNIITNEKTTLIESMGDDVFFQKLMVREVNNQTTFEVLGITKEGDQLQQKIWMQDKRMNKPTLQQEKDYGVPEGKELFSLFSSQGRVGGITKEGELYISKNNRLEHFVPNDANDQLSRLFIADTDKEDKAYVIEEATGAAWKVNFDLGKYEKIYDGDRIIKGSNTAFKDSYQIDFQRENKMIVAAMDPTNEAQLQTLYHVDYSEQGVNKLIDLNLSLLTRCKLAIKEMIVLFLELLVIALVLMSAYYFIRRSTYIFLKITLYILPIMAISMIGLSTIVLSAYTRQMIRDNRKDISSTSALLERGIQWENITELTNEERNIKEEGIYSLLTSNDVSCRLILIKDDSLLITMDNQYPNYYELSKYVSQAEYKEYMQVAKSGEPNSGHDVIYSEGNHYIELRPIKDESNQVIGILEVGENSLYVQKSIHSFQTALSILLVGIVAIVMLLSILVLKITLSPLKHLKDILSTWNKKKQASQAKNQDFDGFYSIGEVIDSFIQEKIEDSYDLAQLTQIYYSFIPMKFFDLLEKTSIGEMTLGSHKKLLKPIAITSYRYVEMLDRKDDWLVYKMNKNFELIHKVINTYNGALSIDHRYFYDLTTLFDSVTNALEASLAIEEILSKENEQDALQQVTLLDYLEVQLELAGAHNRIKPIFMAERLNWLYELLPWFRQLGCDILATEYFLSQVNTIEESEYRYIGYLLGPNDEQIQIYDVFCRKAKRSNEAKEATKATLEAAIKYFQQQEFYIARNLFLEVIKENKEDEVAKYYILKCDELGKKENTQCEVAILTYEEAAIYRRTFA